MGLVCGRPFRFFAEAALIVCTGIAQGGEPVAPLLVARAPFARIGGKRQSVDLLSWSYRLGTFSPSKEQYPWAEFAAGDKSLLVSDDPAKRVTLTFPGSCGWKDVKDGATLMT